MVESSDFEQLSYGMNSYSQFFSQFGVVPKFCLLLGKFERIDLLVFVSTEIIRKPMVFIWFQGEWGLVDLLGFA